MLNAYKLCDLKEDPADLRRMDWRKERRKLPCWEDPRGKELWAASG